MEAVATLIPARAREDGARHVRLSRDLHAINRPTVGRLGLYIRRTVNVKRATTDRCVWTYAAPWDGLTACLLSPSHFSSHKTRTAGPILTN